MPLAYTFYKHRRHLLACIYEIFKNIGANLSLADVLDLKKKN